MIVLLTTLASSMFAMEKNEQDMLALVDSEHVVHYVDKKL